MIDNKVNSYNNLEEDSIEIIPILKDLWNGKKLIIKASFLFFLIGCIAALFSPVMYTSQTIFVPQVSENQMSTSNNGLGSLASLAGINLNTSQSMSDSYLSPLLYSKIVESEEFSLNLLKEKIIDLSGNKFTIKEYLLSAESSFNFNIVEFIKKNTIDLLLNNETKETDIDALKEYNFINEKDFALIKEFKGKFIIELNEKQGYIKVTATDKDAFISSQLVEEITKNLQLKIIELRTNKIKERLEYSEVQYKLKQAEFDLLQKKLAEFKDSNKNISTASFMSNLQKLESEYQLQQNILINLASEYNNNKIKLNKTTPIFSVIDEVSVPNQRTKPRRSIIALTYLIFGIVLSIGYLLGKEHLKEFIKKIRED